MKQGEVRAIVLEVATNAVLAVGIAHLKAGMVPVIPRKVLRDFFVAIEALEGWRVGSELVATRALRCAG